MLYAFLISKRFNPSMLFYCWLCKVVWCCLGVHVTWLTPKERSLGAAPWSLIDRNHGAIPRNPRATTRKRSRFPLALKVTVGPIVSRSCKFQPMQI
jgi:hypothetical protein